MEQQPSSPQVQPHVQPVQKKKSNKLFTFLPWGIIVLLLIIVVLGGFVLFKTDRLAFNAHGVSANVCDEGIMKTYGAAILYTERNGSTESSVDTAGLETLETQIRAKSGYDQDPTCQTILFWTAVQAEDVTKAKTAFAALNTLHDQHKYADSNLTNTAPLSSFQDTINTMTPATKA